MAATALAGRQGRSSGAGPRTMAIRKGDMPTRKGEARALDIPRLADRLIQQSLLPHVLHPELEQKRCGAGVTLKVSGGQCHVA